jgi:hypothetical protein
MVLALSWGCLDMKMGGLLRLVAVEGASLRRVGAFLRLVCLISDRIKCDLGGRYLYDMYDSRKFGHGFLIPDILLIDVSLLFVFMQRTLPVIDNSCNLWVREKLERSTGTERIHLNVSRQFVSPRNSNQGVAMTKYDI